MDEEAWAGEEDVQSLPPLFRKESGEPASGLPLVLSSKVNQLSIMTHLHGGEGWGEGVIAGQKGQHSH